ncbi:MAG: hypothetical protein KGH75_06360 [Rhodospirillales bacterium]|nr:hypothetical protein [Rhodospirillales bacterium]
MALHNSIQGLATESVNECLEAARLLIENKKPDNSIMGYAATLLLFSVTDAISHHLKVGKGHTRLEALNTNGFDLNLNKNQIQKIKLWFRNALIHNATIVPGVFLTSEVNGDVFEFQNSLPIKIRVPCFYEVLKNGWNNLELSDFDPLKDTLSNNYATPPALNHLAHMISPGVSGLASLSGSSTTTPPSGGIILPQPEGDP